MAIIFAFLLMITASGDNITTIEGLVLDDSGQPVYGANVYLEGTYDGTSTNAAGIFRFTTRHHGSHRIIVQALGYKTNTVDVDLDGETIHKIVVISKEIAARDAVSITAGVMEASDESRAVVLRPIDIATTPAAMGDITGAFQTLPGTSSVGNDGRLFVRGGDASETAIFIDGLLVGNAYGTTAPNVPARTRFNPNLFRGSFFSTGGYSAEYGQALSSVLSLKTVDMPLRSQTDFSLMTVGGGVNHTQVWSNSSLIVSANMLDLMPYHSFVTQNVHWERSPYSRNVEISARRRIGSNGMTKAYLYRETGGMSLLSNVGLSGNTELIEIENAYTYGQTSSQYIGKNVIYRGGLSYSYNSETYIMNDFGFDVTDQLMHAKLVAENLVSHRFTLKSGAEFYLTDYRESLRSDLTRRSFRDEMYNVFSEGDYLFSNAFTARAGIRAGLSRLTGREWVHPRISLAYRLSGSAGQISMAGGVFNQFPEPDFRVLDSGLKPVTSRHLILNYMINRPNRMFRAEIFYKDYEGLLNYEGQRFRYEHIRQKGNGVATGFDLFYRDQASFSNADFWVSYSFIQSERRYAGFGTRVQPSFAPKHNGSVVARRFVRVVKSQIGLSLTVNNGYSYTDPRQPGEMNSRTKPFANLSMSWSYLPRPNVIIHLASTNLPGRDNIFGYNFEETQSSADLQAIPVRQSAPRFIMLGIFITFSSDKNANQLNNL